MLNLVLVGYGDKSSVDQMLKIIQNQLNAFLKIENANVYNLDTLYKAEADPEWLRKKHTFRLNTSKDTIREYWGAVAPINYYELYSDFFSSAIDFSYKSNDVYYSKRKLDFLLDEMFKYSNHRDTENKDIYDFSVKYNYGLSESGKTFCVFEWRINESLGKLKFDRAMSYFMDLISLIDSMANQALKSAYITNNTMASIRRLSLLDRIEYDRLQKNILGVEYSFYISNDLLPQKEIIANIESANFCATKRVNGIQYTYKGNIFDYDIEAIRSVSTFFESFVIPAYFICTWCDLCDFTESYDYKPEMVSVYCDEYSINSPDIVFSSGYTTHQLDEIMRLHALSAIGHYKLCNDQ